MDELSDWTLDEKLHELCGSTPHLSGLLGMLVNYNAEPYPAGGNPARGLPALRFTDGPRGVACYQSTCFPVPMARGATWDLGLEERIGDAIGVEARSHGANLVAAVCVNVLRHPGWGRAQETFGEDPFALGQFGAALVRGLQRHVMACVKHFACNSIEDNRFRVDVRVSERTLREVYLPQFRACVEAGAASVMSAYNRVNGEWCGGHRHLLTEILRDEWGFEGFVVSDFVFGAHAPTDLAAGLDLEMPLRLRFGLLLRRALRRGEVPMAAVDTAVARLVRTRRRFAQIGEPERYGPQAVACEAHRALAREAALKAMVLLRNEPVQGRPVLPLEGPIALIGRLATLPLTGDRGSSHVRAPEVITPAQGLAALVDAAYDDGRDPDRAARLAASRPAAVLVVGLSHRDEGEAIPLRFGQGGDRRQLGLRARDEALIAAVLAANPRTVVVLVGGSAMLTEAWRERVPAIVMAWHGGMEGGRALAELLTGRENFSGKLPIAFPRHPGQLPPFDPDADTADYDGPHGYRRMFAEGESPAFPFGFGLSYTRYAYSDLGLGAGDGVVAELTVENTGDRAGEEVVQLYAGARTGGLPRPLWELKGFARVPLAPGERRRVRIAVPARELMVWDGAWKLEPGLVEIGVGPSSDPATWLTGALRLPG